MTILPLSYLGPVQYYSKFLLEGDIFIEQYDNYNKQSYRNRCLILGANGPIPLVIPVKKHSGRKTLVKDILIDYDTDWRRLHWHAIISAYNSSPFFEFYLDSFEPFYTGKFKYLTDYCSNLTRSILPMLDITKETVLTKEYIFAGNKRIINDFREIIHPKKDMDNDPSFMPTTYTQVFDDKFGFVPNLSVIDMLFNTGPEAGLVLRKTLK